MDKKAKKQPKKISERYLENAALYYLQRYATTSENLKRVLQRKIKRSCHFHKTDESAFLPFVDKLVTRYISAGLLNDGVYARAKVTTLRRQGASKQVIAAKLQTKGLSRAAIDSALCEVDAETSSENPELEAALTFAKRKKIGAFRQGKEKDLKKELAVMGRAGFSFDIARRILESMDLEEVS